MPDWCYWALGALAVACVVAVAVLARRAGRGDWF